MMRPPQRFKLFLKYMAAALCCTCLASCSDDLSSSAAQATKPLAVDTEIDETLGVELTDVQTAMSKLEFLVGDWAGPGTSYGDDGTETAYFDTELVRFDLARNLLLINAHGKNPDGSTSHSLHTVIYYDVKTQAYIYTPYSGKSQPRSFNCKLNDIPQLICFTEDETYRLTFQRLADGHWNEFGERLDDGRWSKNFETTLSAR